MFSHASQTFVRFQKVSEDHTHPNTRAASIREKLTRFFPCEGSKDTTRLLMLSTVLASIVLMVPAIIVATIAGPDRADLYAVLGVMPATIVVMYQSANVGRTVKHFASVLCGSGAVGIFAPGIIVNFFLKGHSDKLTWHVWMGLGFLCALGGWALTYAVLRMFAGRSEWFVSKLADRVTGEPPKPDDQK